MNNDMDKFHVNSKTNYRARMLLLNVGLFFLLLLLTTGLTMGQSVSSNRVEDVVVQFLKTWLIKGDVDDALSFISKEPVFPSCWLEKGENLKWREDRLQVIAKIKPVFTKLAKNSISRENLSDLIASQQVKIEYPKLATQFESLFDIYPVNDKLRARLLRSACSDREHDDTEFLKRGINTKQELYLVLFHFKEGLLVTMIWTKEEGHFRLLYLEFPTE